MDYKDILKTKTILFAEDDKDTRKIISSTLELFVKSVIVAQNGEEAYALYKENDPDIIISDINMPILSGIEFIKKVREENTKIPVAIITAHTNTSYLLEAVKLMLVDYVIKPIEMEKLLDVLKQCCKYIIPKTQIVLKNGSVYNLQLKELTHNNKTITLGAKEANLVYTLVSNAHKTFSHSEIANIVWHNSYVSEGALKTIISKIRNKIGKENIKTIKGMGYKIETQNS